MDYSPEHNQTDSPSEITSSTVSELEETSGNPTEGDLEEDANILLKLDPGKMTTDDLEQQCPLFQTFAKSDISTNFLGGVQLFSKPVTDDSEADRNPPSELDRIFNASGLSSRDYLSDESVEIITITDEDEE